MSRVHGKNTVIKLAGTDISQYCTKSSLTRDADIHDTTTYGLDDYRYDGGLKKGDSSIEGVYDSTAVTGPRALIAPLIGTTVAYIRQVEGAGSGKPQDSCNVVVGKYVESNPVADYVTWSLDLKVSGPVNTTPQP